MKVTKRTFLLFFIFFLFFMVLLSQKTASGRNFPPKNSPPHISAGCAYQSGETVLLRQKRRLSPRRDRQRGFKAVVNHHAGLGAGNLFNRI
jgi:hypothetical protein